MIATAGAVPRTARRRSWWENRLKQQTSEGDGTNKKPLPTRNKSSGTKRAKPLKGRPKEAPLISRQGFRSTLTSAGLHKKPQPSETLKEIDSSSESDEEYGECDGSAAVDEASCAEKRVEPLGKQPIKKKKRYILFVGNLPYTADVGSISEYFKKHGTPAKEVRMLSDKATGKSRGCCFLEFETSRTQQSALKLHHTSFEGRKINIEVTCGGGGNTETRREKIKKRNLKLAELRQKRKAPITVCRMATKGDLYQQARSVDGKEFDDWLVAVQNTLQLNDRSQQCLTQLRQLCMFVSVTKYSRNLAPSLYTLLQNVVLEPEQGPPRIRLMASCILRELCPNDNIGVKDFNPPVEESNIPYMLPVLLAQTNARDRISQLALEVFRWLTETGYEDELCLAALSSLYTICSHERALEKFSEEHFRALNLQLMGWLKQASCNCAQVPTASIFSAGGKKQMFPVKEIDGSVSQNIFTLLSIGGYYSSDQLLNIYAFSFIRRWLLVTHTVGTLPGVGPSPAPDYKDGDRSLSRGEGFRSASVTSSINFLGPQSSLPNPLPTTPSAATPVASLVGRARHQLREAIVQYCLRVLDQCERKPPKTTEDDLVIACLYECIAILDTQCTLHRALLNAVFPTCKKMYTRWIQDPTVIPSLLLVMVTFLVKHSDSEVFDTQGPLENLFGRVLNAHFANPSFTFDVVEYLLENQGTLCHSTSIFTKFFPNFLKILAWAPVTYVAEFLQLLPSFISASTALEVLHSLLDLPCLAAVLQVQQLCLDANSKPQYARCVAAFQDTTNKLMFGHFLRMESGRGDTIDRLGLLHQLLGDLSQHPRVTGAAEITPLLLRVFFQTVLYGRDGQVISQVLGAVLERSTLLYNIPAFQEGIKRVLAEQLLGIFRTYPNLVVDFHRDLREHLSNLRTLATGGEPLYLHLTWAVGTYTHICYNPQCTSNITLEFFETLELAAYEVAMGLQQKPAYTTRLVLTLMSSLAKLASRSQDLIPRALLCLNKLVQITTAENPVGAAVTPSCKVLLGHASELVSVLKMPTIAIQVLSPTPYKEKGSDEQQARTTRILQSVVRLAQTNIEQQNLPGGPSSTVPGGPSSTLPGGPSM